VIPHFADEQPGKSYFESTLVYLSFISLKKRGSFDVMSDTELLSVLHKCLNRQYVNAILLNSQYYFNLSIFI